MKRYLLFAFSEYYPNGGMADFKESYDTIEDLKIAIEQIVLNNGLDRMSNINVFDIKNMKYTDTYEIIFDNEIDLDEMNCLVEELVSFESEVER